jgi:hypothetical protein
MLFSVCKGCIEKQSIQAKTTTADTFGRSRICRISSLRLIQQLKPRPSLISIVLSNGNFRRQFAWQTFATGRWRGKRVAMEREMDEADETVRKLKWALLIQREAYQRIRCNPCGVPQGPTPAEDLLHTGHPAVTVSRRPKEFPL